MAEPTMADFLQERVRAPYSYAPSEYTTAPEMRQERISQALGWDTTQPGEEFRNRLGLLAQIGLLAARSPHGARIGNDHAWASQTPSGIMYDGLGASMARRYPSAFRRSELGVSDSRPPAQLTIPQRIQWQEFFERPLANRNSPASNLRTPNERGWWLDNIPGGK